MFFVFVKIFEDRSPGWREDRLGGGMGICAAEPDRWCQKYFMFVPGFAVPAELCDANSSFLFVPCALVVSRSSWGDVTCRL